MIVCADCGKSNSLDSTFCRACGASLPEEQLREQQSANCELIAEGRKLLAAGRLDEARLAVQAALEANPSDPDAWALCGDCHEHGGDLAQALEAYERVLELRPDNALDRIKIQHLRQLLSARALQAAPPARRGPALAAAAAAVVLVGSLGATLALLNHQGAPPEPATRPPGQMGAQNQPTATPPVAPPANQAANPAAQPQEGPEPPVAREQPPPQARNDPRVPPPMRPIPGDVLPMPAIGGTVNLGGDRPLPVSPPPAVTVTPERRPETPHTGDPDPVLERPPAEPERGPGRIDIRPTGEAGKTIGGSVTLPDQAGGNRAQALVQTARELFRLGDYAQAADAYERAVSAGATDGATLQRLAQTYERLGRNADAASAYERAIRAFEAELSRRESARARSGLEACRQALRLLQGT
jgi:tetratricopeptide (TPR) repeat protein